MNFPKKEGYHRHHVIPKHAGGGDDKENLIYLTPEEHALAHLELYELYGYIEDLLAYNYLITNWCNGRAIRGYKQSEEHIRKRIESTDYGKISKKLKGRESPTKGMKLGPPSDSTREKISSALKGKPHDDERKRKISETLTGKESPKKILCYCIFCRKRVPPSRFDRHGINKSECITKDEYERKYSMDGSVSGAG